MCKRVPDGDISRRVVRRQDLQNRRPVKPLLIIPLIIVLVAGLGHVVCRLGGIHDDTHELLVAGVVNLIAAEAALVPLWLARRTRDAGLTSQLALAGTVMQMFVCIALAIVARLAGLSVRPQPFAWWMLVLYWTALIAVVATAVCRIGAAAQAATDSARPSEQATRAAAQRARQDEQT